MDANRTVGTVPATRLAMAAVLLLTAWLGVGAQDPARDEAARQLLGRWQLVNQALHLSIEFFDDRTYEARTARGTARGQWALVDAEHLATWTSEQRPRRVNRFALRGRHLVITDSDGIHHVHRRVTSTAATPAND